MSPDIPYILTLTPTHAPGHSFYGVIVYCLVPSLVGLFVWYRWIEKPILDLFGLTQPSRSFDLAGNCMVLLGVLIGAYSHVLWDATSHADGAFVVGNEFWQIELLSLPLYKWNQYASGVLGIMALSFWYIKNLLRNKKNAYRGHPLLGITIYTVCILFFVALANLVHESAVLYDYVIRSSVGLITGGVFATCLYALVMNLRQAQKMQAIR